MLKNDKQLVLTDLENQELFKDVDFSVVMPLLSDCTIYNIKQDEVLIRQAEQNHCLFLILSGSFNVLLTLEKSKPIAILATGQSLGEISIIDHKPSSAFVKAAEDSQVLLIEEKIMRQLINDSHAIAINLIRILSQRLRKGNLVIQQITGLLSEQKHHAVIDPLTGFYNRRWLDHKLHRIMQRCDKEQKPLTVMMIDIDNFKIYNDSNGHLAGDIALRTVAEAIRENLRPEDMVARYGGEELFALLPGIDLDSAMIVAERLRIAVKQTPIQHNDGQSLPCVTVSVGIAEMKDVDNLLELIEAADKAMYQAKHSGRDQVCR